MGRKSVLALWLVAIFFLGLTTRIYLQKYTYIFGFDSYWFARMVSYIIRFGHLPSHDPLTFRGFPPVPIQWEISMDLPAWIYKAVYGSHYDRMQLLNVFKWVPAVFGALGSVFAALIGLVVAGPLASILAGIFAATNPGYIYRTLSGFYEDDATAAILVLGVLLALWAYGQKDRKRFWGYTALAAVTLLIAAISWQGFYILPYTAAVFAVIWTGYHVAVYLSQFLENDAVRKYEYYVVPGVGAVAALIAGFIVKSLAYKEAADALYLTGTLSQTTIYTIALSYFAIAAWGAFAASAVVALRRKDTIYGYIAIASVALALLTTLSAANRTAIFEIQLPDGTASSFQARLGSFGAALFGTALLILVSQLAGALAAYLIPESENDGKKRFSIDWRIAAVVFIPLLVAGASCWINGFCWMSNALHVLIRQINPPAPVDEGSKVLVKPYRGFIDPLTGGPWAEVIGEETVGFLNWPAKYGILAVLVLFSIPFLAYRAREDRRYIFLLAWVALTWWAAWYKLKFAYYFGVPIAIAVAVSLKDLWDVMKRWGRPFAAATAAFILIVSVSMAATGMFHTVSKVPTLVTSREAQEMYMFGAQPADDYIELFHWIEANTPKDANLLNWWSIGHWLTFFTDRGVMTDNTNYYYEADVEAAQFFLFDENTAYSIAKKRHMNYAIVESSLLWGAPSLAIYAYRTDDLRDPRLAQFRASFAYCTPSDSPLYRNKYVCTDRAGHLLAVIDANRFDLVPPFGPGFYQETNGAIMLVIGKQKYVMYKAGQQSVNGRTVDTVLLLPPKLNDSMLVKFLLHAPMKHFKFVWASKNQKVLVYEIK